MKLKRSFLTSATPALDMVDTYIIKLIKADILPALTPIINLSITTKVFPTPWKKEDLLLSQARAIRKGSSKDSDRVMIRTPSKVIEPSQCEKLLGCWSHLDMNFEENILNNEESLLRSLNTRIGALKVISRVANFRTRKIIADGIVMTKLIYLIALWGWFSKILACSFLESTEQSS